MSGTNWYPQSVYVAILFLYQVCIETYICSCHQRSINTAVRATLSQMLSDLTLQLRQRQENTVSSLAGMCVTACGVSHIPALPPPPAALAVSYCNSRRGLLGLEECLFIQTKLLKYIFACLKFSESFFPYGSYHFLVIILWFTFVF